ncbi:hypothetical protein K458DRAFT_43639 [Lentithecium fluviatile CBS 122367]|uniref:Ubiquitin 3 binding protein But2 C-terminal domain-containing protein n=1 Tax=Lentithecium fluviatile CBS 122367 TaxID=1168545 RepID=A0A6G1J0L3_9PLEO|nr:hypothetical protein K458DRAFT_43639 [Lentithecium fluviatile CBS 122367]
MRSTFLLAALSASSALASPWGQYQYTTDLEITVDMSNSAAALGSRTNFMADRRQEQPPNSSRGPFKTVNIKVGKNVQNKAIRCKLLDNNGAPIKAARGPNNVDTTFADAGKGEWTFLQESEVSSIICDPAFKKGDGTAAQPEGDKEIRVLLQDQGTELGIPFTLREGSRDELVVGTSSEFSSIELTVPAAVKDSLRCQLLDKAGMPITLKRNANVDTTFADGGAGPWQFETPKKTQVGKIVCDPTFKKAA